MAERFDVDIRRRDERGVVFVYQTVLNLRPHAHVTTREVAGLIERLGQATNQWIEKANLYLLATARIHFLALATVRFAEWRSYRTCWRIRDCIGHGSSDRGRRRLTNRNDIYRKSPRCGARGA